MRRERELQKQSEVQLVPAVADESAAFHIKRKGAGLHQPHLTVNIQLVVAIRKNISNTSAKDFGGTVLEDISGNSAIRAALVLAATRIATFSMFHNTAVTRWITTS